MAIAIDPTKPFKYVLREDRDAERPTTWMLKPLTVGEQSRIQDAVAVYDRATEHVAVRSGTQDLEVLRLGLVGVEEFYDIDGNAVPFDDRMDKRLNRSIVTDAFLSRLRATWRVEIANAITEAAALTETDRKNSSSAPVL